MWLPEHTENTEKGCTEAAKTAVHRLHQKCYNIGKTKQRGVQNVQYQRYSIIQMGGPEHTKNTRDGCTNDPETAVHRFHEKLQNMRKIQQRGAQLSQYQWDLKIPCDSQNTQKTQKKGVQRPQKQQYADYMRMATI